MPVLLTLFIVVPLIEMAILIQVGKLIGLWQTILLVVGLSMFGAYIIRHQGIKALLEAQAALARGKLPINSVLDGAFLTLAGGLLLTPGLLTDAIGLLLLIPPLRQHIAHWSFERLMKRGNIDVRVFRPGADESGAHAGSPEEPSRPGQAASTDGPVIDAEFERIGEKTVRPTKPNSQGNGARRPPWRQ